MEQGILDSPLGIYKLECGSIDSSFLSSVEVKKGVKIYIHVVVHTHKGATWFWVVEKEDIEHGVDPVPMRKTLKITEDTIPDLSTLV